MHRLPSALILTTVLLGLSGGAGTALAKSKTYVPPKQFVLTARDLPRGFQQTVGRSLGNAEAERDDHLPAGTYSRHGRITSYETIFRSSGLHIFSVDDTVIAFKSPGGAHWRFLRSVNKGRNPAGGRRFQPLTVGRIGDEATGFRYQVRTNGFPVTCGITLFRRSTYAVTVITCGLTGVYPLTASPALARIIDRRIRTATART